MARWNSRYPAARVGHYYVTTSSGAAASTRRSWTSPRSGQLRRADEGRRQKSIVFLAGNCVVVCLEPRARAGAPGAGCASTRRVGTLNFEVEDVERAFRLLEAGRDADRRRPALRGRERERDRLLLDHHAFGAHRSASSSGAATGALPGLRGPRDPRGGRPPRLRGLRPHDSNFPPWPRLALARARDGIRAFWRSSSTRRRGPEAPARLRPPLARLPGPASGVKFANNEPWRPNFRGSQINASTRSCGARRQHSRSRRRTSWAASGGCGSGGSSSCPPRNYYDALPARSGRPASARSTRTSRCSGTSRSWSTGRPGKYLLQVFLKEFSGMYTTAGRALSSSRSSSGRETRLRGGNFRALFESIERAQKAQPQEAT